MKIKVLITVTAVCVATLASAAAVGAAALFGAAPAQADPCAGITDPKAHDACIKSEIYRRERRMCEGSSLHGQIGQVCG